MTLFLTNKPMINDAMRSITSITLNYFENKIQSLEDVNIPKQEYVKKIADNTFSIMSIFKEIDYILNIISKHTINEANENTTDEIIYHLKNYFIRISSLQDLAKNLINNTYRLGISENKCTIELLLDNEFTRKTKAIMILTDLKNYIKEYRVKRNKIIHQGEFEDERIGQLALLNFYKFERNDPRFDIEKINKLIRDNLEKISNSIKEEIDILKASFESLYDSLQETYDLKIEEFNSEK